MAMERVISYFLTDVQILNTSEDETEKWQSFFNDVLDIKTVIQNMLRGRMCFHGDTKVITAKGVFRLRELAGQTVDVLSDGGVYRAAEFKSFGRQELLEVEFSDGRKILATPDHEWIVVKSSGGYIKVPTTRLAGRCIQRVVAPRPPQNEDFFEGVRHGFTVGDGSLYHNGKQASATFFGAKDAVMLKYFKGHGCDPVPLSGGRDAVTIRGLPAHYKTLPANDCSPSYWYGFVCGFMAADGSADTYGCAVLTQKAKATLEVIYDQLPRIGMAGGPVRGHYRTAHFVRQNGKIDTYSGKMHYLTLLKQFMLPQDFLLPAHRANFVENYTPTRYGEHIGVRDVRETGIVDEVFCCVEPETHTFVLGNGVLTGNCYGNSFASMLVPFRRFLVCPKCHSNYILKEVFENKHAFGFEWNMPQFIATCPVCKVGSGYRGPWKVNDQADDEEKKIKVKIWNPHEIEILHDEYTHDADYLWRIPEDYKRQIRQGHLYHLERAPMEVIKAIHNNYIYRFLPDEIYHMKEPTLAGIVNRSWGIPRILSNFRQIWYVQVLRRFNEAIALDYVIPFRVITPAPAQGRSGNGTSIDPLQMYNGSDFRNQISSMIRKRARDPASLQVLPFPVSFQMFGADATKLAPRELLDQGMETLLNDAGAPIELYNGSLQLQTAPVALRLFESTWHHLVHDANAFLAWLVRQASQIMSWEVIDAELKRVTIADNLEKQMMAAQLMMSQQLSGSTVLGDLGWNWRKEQKQISEEATYQSELQSRTQEEMQQSGFAQQIAKGQQQQGDPSQQGGQPQGGGQGAGAAMGTPMQGPVTQYLASTSPNVAQTPDSMLQVAASMAQDLMGQPESVKDSEMRKLNSANKVLHDIVKADMDKMRSDAKSKASQGAVGQMEQQAQQPQQGQQPQQAQ